MHVLILRLKEDVRRSRPSYSFRFRRRSRAAHLPPPRAYARGRMKHAPQPPQRNPSGPRRVLPLGKPPSSHFQSACGKTPPCTSRTMRGESDGHRPFGGAAHPRHTRKTPREASSLVLTRTRTRCSTLQRSSRSAAVLHCRSRSSELPQRTAVGGWFSRGKPTLARRVLGASWRVRPRAPLFLSRERLEEHHGKTPFPRSIPIQARELGTSAQSPRPHSLTHSRPTRRAVPRGVRL